MCCCSVHGSVVDTCPTNRVAELGPPHPDTLKLVYTSLGYHGVLCSVTTSGGHWLTLVGVPVSHSNELLGASYQVYLHSETNDALLRTVDSPGAALARRDNRANDISLLTAETRHVFRQRMHQEHPSPWWCCCVAIRTHYAVVPALVIQNDYKTAAYMLAVSVFVVAGSRRLAGRYLSHWT